MSTLAIIPARSGSKGIKDKNIQKIGCKSLIQMAFECASECPLVTTIYVSTDSQAYFNHAVEIGADPILPLRPKELSGDFSTALDVIKHGVEQCSSCLGINYDNVIYLEPTSPMRRVDDILKCISLISFETHTVFTVSRTPAHYCFEKSMTLGANMSPNFLSSNYEVHANRHTIGEYYHKNGICYAFKLPFQADRSDLLPPKNTKAVVTDRPVVNIDEDLDLEFAKFLLNRKPEI